jgi:tetratricopeptide (TPR) repeat protein
MRNFVYLKIAVLAVALGAVYAPALLAQDPGDYGVSASGGKGHKKLAPLYPNATRSDPAIGISSTDMDEAITKLLATVNTNKNNDEAIAMGEKIVGNHDANHYDRALAEQAIGYAYLNKGDRAKGIEHMQKAITENALPNNEHYPLMLQVAKTQIAAGQPDAGLATLDRVIAETRQDKPEYNGIRGRVAYAKKDYAAAAAALEKSIGGSAQPDPNEQQMLLMSYVELKQPDRAEKIAEGIAHAHPDDKAAVLNLATIYQQEGKPDKAAAQLDDARKRGLLTDANDYRKLYVLYSNIKGRENDSAAVINEGLQKGVLQPNAEVYTLLAEDYYFTNQIPQAIEAYKKADAVSTDGEAALNLAKVYNNQGQPAEAKAAAEHALQKGVKRPEEAHVIIEHAGTATRKPVKKK